MELKEFIAWQVQSLQPLDIAEGFEDYSWVADRWYWGEEVTGDVQIFEIFELKHVIGQLLKIIGR